VVRSIRHLIFRNQPHSIFCLSLPNRAYNDILTADWCCDDLPRLGQINPIANIPLEEAEEKLVRYLGAFASAYAQLERDVLQEQGVFMGGQEPHFGEFGVFHIVDMVCTLDGGSSLGEQSTELQAWFTAMQALPAISSYLDARPKPGSIGVPGSIFATHADPANRTK
jgi:hypothetical protein